MKYPGSKINQDSNKNYKKLSGSISVKNIILIIVACIFLFLTINYGEQNRVESKNVVKPEEELVLNEIMLSNALCPDSEIEWVRMSEVMPFNKSFYPDSEGDYYGWIEISNYNNIEMGLKNYTLIYLSEKTCKYTFPDLILKPGESLVFFASGKNTNINGQNHLNFEMGDKDAELIFLEPSGYVLDRLSYTRADENISFAKTGLAGSPVLEAGKPTPGKITGLTRGQAESYKGLIAISELMPHNSAGIQDSSGNFSDWIEITNYSDLDIDLDYIYISDDKNNLTKWAFPEMKLKAGEVMLVFASGKDKKADLNELHVNFKLNKSGETVILSTAYDIIIDTVMYDEEIKNGSSYSRSGGISGQFLTTAAPTPYFYNTEEGLIDYYKKFDSGKDLLIYEVMTSNDIYLKQRDGKCYDWFQIKNVSGRPINISEYSMGKKSDFSLAWNLPDKTLAPGEIYVIIASGNVKLSSSDYPHTPFRLNAESENIFLFDKNGKCIDSILVSGTTYRGSYGRMNDQAGFFYFTVPSPGNENTSGIRGVTLKPSVDKRQGVYKGIASFTVILSGNGEIYYTLDGSEPTIESNRYSSPLNITKTTILRAIAVEQGKGPSEIMTANYFIDIENNLPVVSLVGNPDDFWSEKTGIYAMGSNAQNKYPYYGANFWQDWEKKVNVSMYENGSEQFSIDCGVKIFGGWGRGEEKKSFNLKFRGIYGVSQLKYPVFGDNFKVTEFDSLILRSGSQDSNCSAIRDVFMTSLAADGMPALEVQAYRFCSLYINGEYWGVYAFREKVNDEFIAGHYNTTSSSVSLLNYSMNAENGSAADFRSLIDYVRTHDMKISEHYRYVEDRVDFTSYIDWMIAEAYSGNRDLDNVRFFRTNKDNGKWKWILYDFDLAFIKRNLPFTYLCSETQYTNNTILFNALIKNSDFRELFFTRLSLHLKTTLSTKTALTKIDLLYGQIAADMKMDRNRWGYKYTTWEKYISGLRNFVYDAETGQSRVKDMANDAAKYFSMTQAEISKYFSDLE